MVEDTRAPSARQTAPVPRILSIAGSDPSGGAGIQADLKAIAANGGYGMAAVTALTAQNTRGVRGVRAVEPDFVYDQIAAVFDDVVVDAVKIGMIAEAEIARAVARALRAGGARNVVLDPVMIATSGDLLLRADAVAALRDELLPLTRVVTPNLPEARALLEASPLPDAAWSREAMRATAERLLGLGAEAVMLKGGHMSADAAASPDLLLSSEGSLWLEGPRIAGRALHGGGCTLSAALATQLARAGDLATAARRTKAYVSRAVAGAERLSVGGGGRPLDHFPDGARAGREES